MKKIVGMAILLMGFSTCAFGALSPLDQSITELKKIIESPDLRKSLQTTETIQDIWKVGNRYVLSTENRQLVVDVVYSPRSTPGPQNFQLVFYPPKPFGE